MPTKVTMPQMGESIFEGTLTKWLKKVGDTVVRDEPLFEISTDKVDSEIPSPVSGTLSQILVPEGKTVQINTVLAIIDEGGLSEATDGVVVPSTDAAEKQPSEAPVPEPRDQPEPMPESQLLPAPPSEAAVGESGTVTGTIREAHAQEIRTSPLVRRLARENNIDLSGIRGTGLEGRITKDDVLKYIERRSEPSAAAASSPQPRTADPTSATALPGGTVAISSATAVSPHPAEARDSGEGSAVPMTAMRKAIAEHMVLSKKTSAHVNTVFEVDVTPIVQVRGAHKADFDKREGFPLTYTPFFAKALVDNVREFPIFNTSVSGDSIVYKNPVNLGIAVALETGLIVPVVKDAHLKSFTGLALAIFDLAERARTKKLKPDDVQNGTISMTNPGSFGALFGTPIISQPQVAILGIGGIAKRPVVVNDAIAIRSIVHLSLTFDHRVIDGAVADHFMARLKERLQSWTQWVD
jgi:2-oxoglutarate dehydrogenase E2 component (dihydrolipoamide succinyltransferase)